MNSPIHIMDNPSLEDTIKLIFSQLGKSNEVAWLLDEYELRRADPLEAAKVIHRFTRNNIRYKLDPKSWELVRSAKQSWIDRQAGVDCEDLTIFQASLMREQGHGQYVVLTIVDLDANAPGMEHIYPSLILPDMSRPRATRWTLPAPIGIAFDSLLPFGTHPTGIVMTMQLMALGGFAQSNTIAGLGRTLTPAEQRKTQWIENADTDVRHSIAAIIPYVEDIAANGMIIWKPGTDARKVAELIENHSAEGLGDLGRKKKKPKPVVPLPSYVTPVTPPPRKKRSVGQTIARVSPLLILGRNAFLLLVRTNALKLGSHLRLVFMRPEVAAKSKIDPQTLKIILAQRPKIQKKWEDLGGDINKLKAAIAAASHVDVSRLSGLATDPATGAATASAVPVLVVLAPILAAVPWRKILTDADGNKVDDTTKDGKSKKLDGAALVDGLNKVIKSVRAGKSNTENAAIDNIVNLTDEDEDNGKGNGNGNGNGNNNRNPDKKPMAWYVWALLGLGVVGVGGVAVYAMSDKKVNSKRK